MAQKIDPLRGLNPDQSGPIEKIQNGDPKSSPNRDQRSGAAEAGGPNGSLQKAPANSPDHIEPHDNLVVSNTSVPLPEGVNAADQEPVGSRDRAGLDPATGETVNPSDTTAEPNNKSVTTVVKDDDTSGDTGGDKSGSSSTKTSSK